MNDYLKKTTSILILVVIAIFFSFAFSCAEGTVFYYCSFSFEEDVNGEIPNGWKQAFSLDPPNTDAYVTNDANKVSPIPSMVFPFPNTKALYIKDATKDNSANIYTPISSDKTRDLFFSADFKIINEGDLYIQFYTNDLTNYTTRIRFRPNTVMQVMTERNPTANAQGEELINANKWYRIQGRINCAKASMDFTLISDEGEIIDELKNLPTITNSRDYAIGMISFNTGSGGAQYVGEFAVDNVYAKELEFCGLTTIETDKPTLTADNISEATIALTVKDDFNSATSDVPVTLSVPEGHDGVFVKGKGNWGETATAITDSNGQVQFKIRGSKSGPVTLTATAEHPANWDEGIIQQMTKTLTITFIPAVSSENSTITIQPADPISADGVSSAQVTVKLAGFDPTDRVSNREVTLLDLPPYVTVKDGAGNTSNKADTDENGEASFWLTSKGSWQGPIKAQVDRTDEELEPLVLEGQTLEFKGLLFKSEYILGPEYDVYNGKVPADGSSSFILELSLFDETDNPVEGCLVDIEPITSLTIEPLGGNITNKQGKLLYKFYTQVPGSYNLNITAEAGTFVIAVPVLTFEVHTEEYPPVVVATIPKDLNDDYEVTDPIQIYFNKTIDLEQSINLSLTFNSEGKQLVAKQGDTNGNWDYSQTDKKITWTPAKPLWANLQINTTLVGAADSAGFPMDPYSWNIIAIDTTGPALIDSACYPRPGEIEVPIDAKVKLTFDEPIYSEGDTPVGLEIMLVNVTTGQSQTFSPVDISFVQNGTSRKDQVELQLPDNLSADTIYELEISGALDNAQNHMEPEVVTWRFSTIDTIPPQVVAEYPAKDSVIPEGSFEREISLSFSENVDLSDAVCSIMVWNEERETWEDANLVLSSDYDEVTLTWTLYPVSTEWIYNKEYKVIVSGVRDKIEDPYGEPKTPNLMGEYSWQFKPLLSASAPEPQENPGKNATGVSIAQQIEITFNKAIVTENTAITLKLKGKAEPIPGQISFINEFGTTATGIIFKPADFLQYDTWYEVTVSGIMGELAGSELPDYSYNFRTEALGATKSLASELDNSLHFAIGPVVGDSRREINVFVPAGAVKEETQLSVLNLTTDEKLELNRHIWSEGQHLSPDIYEFRLVGSGDTSLQKKSIITIPFTDDGTGNVLMLDGSMVPASSLQVFAWNSARGEWIPTGGRVDLDAQTVSCEVNDFGIYGLLGTTTTAKEILSDVALTVNPLAFPAEHRQETTFKFRLSSPGIVTLVIYDSKGKVVTTLLKDVPYPNGYNAFTWDGYIDGKRIRPGIYLYRLFATSLDSANRGDVWVSGTFGVIR